MTATALLLDRNARFSEGFDSGDMPALPKLGTMIRTCIDARVDPAHVLGLDLGDCVVFRNNGSRVTQNFVDEVTALAIMVAKMSGAMEAAFDIVLMQHTKCGAQSFADPQFQTLIKQRTGVDVTPNAITNQRSDLLADIQTLRDAPHIPGGIRVAAMLYDVETGIAQEVAPPTPLADLRH